MTAAIALPERQQTPEWRKRRSIGLGSSDAPVIAGVAPWGDIRTLFAEKVGWAAPIIETRPMAWGKWLEPAIAAAYSEQEGRKVRRVNRLLRHRTLPWMLASLDRVVVGEPRLVEIKTARYADERWGAAGTDEIPDHVRIQVEHQMAVTGYEIADVVVLFAGSDLRVYTVESDLEVRTDLQSLEQAFWNAVQAKSLPADLADLGPRPVPLREGEVDAAEIPAPIALLAHRVAEARHAAKGIDAVKEMAEAELKAAIDEFTAIRGEGFRITYRQQGDRQQIGWEQVAAGYRTRLEEMGADVAELDTLRDLFTTTRRGNRPLLITMKEPTDDVPL